MSTGIRPRSDLLAKSISHEPELHSEQAHVTFAPVVVEKRICSTATSAGAENCGGEQSRGRGGGLFRGGWGAVTCPEGQGEGAEQDGERKLRKLRKRAKLFYYTQAPRNCHGRSKQREERGDMAGQRSARARTAVGLMSFRVPRSAFAFC